MKLKARKRNRTFDDRFIPRRLHSSWDYAFSFADKTLQDLEEKDILTQDVNEYVREKYREVLRRAMGFPSGCRLLFPAAKEKPAEETAMWPVKQRRKPIMSTPDCALDLPEFKALYFYNLLDWGARGYLAAALNLSVFLCHPTTNETIHLTNIDKSPFSPVDGREYGTAVKWDIDGNRLAIGTNKSTVQIWNSKTKKLMIYTWCTCIFRQQCIITCIVWSICNQYLVSGCSHGKLSLLLTPNGRVGDFRIAHEGKVVTASCSLDGKYLASVGGDNTVRLWIWPHLQPHFEILFDYPAKAISWHPWKSSMLAIGGGVEHGTISIYNVNNCKRVATNTPLTKGVILSLAWSSLTGELVASYWIIEDSEVSRNGGHSEVLVLSSLNKVVDKFMIGFPTQVMYLLWGPDGKKIATASTDETLRIWNFIHTAVEKKPEKCHSDKSVFFPDPSATNFLKYTVR